MSHFKPSRKSSTFTMGLALGCFSLLNLSACNKVTEVEEEETLDGQGAFITAEIDQMGQSLHQIPAPTLGKVAGNMADTLTGELVIESYAYQEACECFVRKAEFTGSRGYERQRLDSVTLVDSAGEILSSWQPLRIAKIVHKRHVTHTKGAHAIDVHFNTEAVFKRDNGMVVGVWNGTMTGSFDGDAFKSATVSQVTREFKNGRFGFPISGSVAVERPLRTYALQFMGEGDAQVTITHRRTGRVTVITVDRNFQEKVK